MPADRLPPGPCLVLIAPAGHAHACGEAELAELVALVRRARRAASRDDRPPKGPRPRRVASTPADTRP
jgi:hypothetical protein